MACQSIRQLSGKNQIKKQLDQNNLGQHFNGLALYDPLTSEWLLEKNSDKYFTPASNVKLLSLYAGIMLLKDSIPGILYQYRGDSLFIRGAGDPTFLHPDFIEQKIYTFLSEHDGPIILVPDHLSSKPFGPGWSWDDYQYRFQPERSELPIYGNVVRVNNENYPLSVEPEFFFDDVITNGNNRGESRYVDHNIFLLNNKDRHEQEIPFRTYPELIATLLEDTLRKKVLVKETTIIGVKKYSQASEALYSIMMKRSDNFYAEQLLIMCSSTFSDTLSVEKTIAYVKNRYLSDLPDQPIWVDGSGLSRYNLITPRSQVHLLNKLRNEKGDEWLASIFPVGGASGTIKNWYEGNPMPYVIAKTGTLSNNHNLSGYLKTVSGRTLIFSFMNNNYVVSNGVVKQEMQEVLQIIRDKF